MRQVLKDADNSKFFISTAPKSVGHTFHAPERKSENATLVC